MPNVASFYCLTYASYHFQQQHHVWLQGSYASLGICRTPTEWRNMAVVLGIVGGLLGLNWGMKQAKTSSSSTKRRKALQELEKDE
jgi:translocon-associated protein subunit beta